MPKKHKDKDKVEPHPNYGIGYGQPPESTRFQPGKSGNPKGRPKGSRNLSTVLLQAVGELIVINVNGKRKTITKFAAAMTQLVNKAASGDIRAIRELNAAVRLANQDLAGETAQKEQLNEDDQKVVRSFLKRLQHEAKEDTSREEPIE